MRGRRGLCCATRRGFLRRAAEACFVIPLFRNGTLGQPVAAPGSWFRDIADPCGLSAFRDRSGSPAKDLLVETVGSGVALFDYNHDGLLDVFLVNGSTFEILSDAALPRTSSRLFRNNGDGTFTDVTKASGLLNEGWGIGVAVADFDNDGHPDVFISNFGANALFRNNGDGTFSNITREAGVEGGNWSTGCAWGDYDGDGRLDLYVARYVDFDRTKIPRPESSDFCRYQGLSVACGPRGLRPLPDFLYHNEGNGKFREVSREAGLQKVDPAYGLGVVWSDLDNDGALDIFVANDSMPNFLYHNNKDGTFTEIGFEAGCALSGDGRAQACMGIAVGDYDNDGWIDLFVTNFSEDYDTLDHKRKGSFDDVSMDAGLRAPTYKPLGWGTSFLDFDQDGWKDLFVANGHIYPQANLAGNSYNQPNMLFRNLRNGRFELLPSAESGFTVARSSRGSAFGDFDNSGRLSVVVNNIDEVPFVYAPAPRSRGGWVRLKLTGTKSNRDAVGARVRLTANGLTQLGEVHAGESYASTCDPRLHFGLGTATIIETVEIRWPSGTVERHGPLGINQEFAFVEGKG